MRSVGAPIVRFGCAVFAMVGATLLVRTATDADAATSAGTAYDTVIKLVSTPDPPLRQRDFGADFHAGTSRTASCMSDVVRRYVTPDRERIDDVCRHEATVVDCVTRTVTFLDLEHKQYTRTPLDTVYDDGIAEIRALSDQVGSTSTLTIERSAHGTRVIDDVPTEEYANVRTQRIASPGLTLTTRDSYTYEFLADPLPRLACIERAAPWLSRYGSPQQYAPELQGYFSARFMKMAGPRDRVTEHGSSLPDWRIPLFAVGVHDQRQSEAPDSTQYFEIESGNVRVIQSDDPVFRVPADSTKMAQ